jgi:6-pyruvoyl-tetrahydropterin synthase
MVKDFYDIKLAVQPIVDRLDHQHLGYGPIFSDPWNAIMPSSVKGIPEGFLPTSENMLVWIASEIPRELPWCKLELNETCTSSAVLERWEHTRYFVKEGGNHGRQEEGDEEGRQEGKEVPAQGKEEVTSPYITDDDIPF